MTAKNVAVGGGLALAAIVLYLWYSKSPAPNWSPATQARLTPAQIANMTPAQLAAIMPGNLNADALTAYQSALLHQQQQQQAAGLWGSVITGFSTLGSSLFNNWDNIFGSSPTSPITGAAPGTTYTEGTGLTVNVGSDGSYQWSDGTTWAAGTTIGTDPNGNLYVADPNSSSYVPEDDPNNPNYIP